MRRRGRSSDSGLPPPPPSRPVGQWSPAEKQLPSQRRDRPGFAPDSLTACRWRRPYHGPMPTSRAFSVWLPVVAWAAVIFALSSIPSLSTGLGFWDTLLRKAAHVTEYAILGALLVRALRHELPALVVGIAYAATDELHQHFVRGRHAAARDVVIGDTRPLWRDWLEDASRRFRTIAPLDPAALPADRGEAATELDRWAEAGVGDWRAALQRFAEDRAPVYLRPRAEVSAALRTLSARGIRLGVFTDAPEPL